MKITKLRLEAFRSFTATEFDLDFPRVMIAGLNEAGKTTVREAIRFLLTGKAQGLDGKGSGVEVLSPAFIGTTEVAVSAEIPGVGPLERTWKPTGGGLVVKRFTGNNGVQQQALYETLNTTEAYLQAVLDSETFLNLHHADAKALVLALLQVIVVVNEGGNGKEYTLPELDAAYKKAYDDRRAAKTVRVTIPPVPEGEYAPLDAIDARLTELANEGQKLAASIGTTAERRRSLKERIDVASMPTRNLPVTAVDLPVQIAELEKRLAVMEEEAAPDDIDATMQTLPRNTDVVDSSDVAFLKGRAEALAQHKPSNGCVLDPEVRCDTAKVNFSKRAKVILAELDAATPAPAVPVPAAIKAPSPMTEVRHRLEGLQREQEAYTKAAEAERVRLDRLEAMTKELAALPDTAALEADLAALKDRIEKGQTIRAQAILHLKRLEDVQTAQQRAKDVAAEVDRLEALVDVLGPNGARVDALAKALGPFTVSVNDLTGQFGWKVEFVLDPWSVMVNGRPVETYSRSERYRIGTAIQLSIAATSGLSFAVVDELDMLNKENRDLFGRLLYFSSLEQIIILGTREPDVPLPTIDKMVAYRLGKVDGKSGILERVTA